MTPGAHWEAFIRSEIDSSRYINALEVVQAGLRELEERSQKLTSFRAHLDEGLTQAERGEFVKDFSINRVIDQAKRRA